MNQNKQIADAIRHIADKTIMADAAKSMLHEQANLLDPPAAPVDVAEQAFDILRAKFAEQDNWRERFPANVKAVAREAIRLDRAARNAKAEPTTPTADVRIGFPPAAPTPEQISERVCREVHETHGWTGVRDYGANCIRAFVEKLDAEEIMAAMSGYADEKSWVLRTLAHIKHLAGAKP